MSSFTLPIMQSLAFFRSGATCQCIINSLMVCMQVALKCFVPLVKVGFSFFLSQSNCNTAAILA